MKPIIELDGVSKRYNVCRSPGSYRTLRESLVSLFRGKACRKDLWALKDITFAVQEGTVVGIIGENGAGKTTLLKILSRITPPTQGRAVLRGRVASLLDVGTGFHQELTGRENIFLNGSILGLSVREIKKRLEDILAFAELEDFIDTPLKHYSTGMAARLAFSVAAHLDPDILFVDEVLSVGDAEFQRKSLGRMGDLAKSGRTVLFVSHNLQAVRQLCSQCLLLSRGRLQQIGHPNEVIAAYLSLQTQHESGIAVFPKDYPRSGNQQIRLTRIELHNQHDMITGVYGIGDDLCIHLYLTGETKMRTVRMALEIRESDGQQICNIFDSDSYFAVNDVSEETHVSARINDLRFYPGLYTIGLELASGVSGWLCDRYDYLQCCISFKMSNNLVSTRELHRKDGLLYLTPRWQRHEATGR
jgi:lipopolysaccharide transport system ATP-binding protein